MAVGPRFDVALPLVSLAIILISKAGGVTSQANFMSKLPILNKMPTKLIEKSPAELRNDFNIFLKDLGVRKISSLKDHSESILQNLYREKRMLIKEIKDLDDNLAEIARNSDRNAMRIIELDVAQEETGSRSNLKFKVSKMTEDQIQTWTKERVQKQIELERVRATIDQQKLIRDNPGDYVAVPRNFCQENPKVVRHREQQVLIKDRENMHYRANLRQPIWMTDNW